MRFLSQLFSPHGRYIELSESIREHLEEKIDDLVEDGMSPAEAATTARREFGDVTLIEEISREVWQWPIESIWADLKRAAEQLRKSPAFILAAIVTLALGIGANTAIFTLVNAELMKPLPVVAPRMLYRVGDQPDCCTINGFMNHDGDFSLFSYDLYQHLLRTSPQEFEHLAAMQAGTSLMGVRQGSEPAKSEISEFVSGNYFVTFGLNAFLGRTLIDSDDKVGASPVVVMSYDEWRSDYASDPSLVGKTLYVQGQPVTLVGIAPPGFFGDRINSSPPALWLPLSAEPVIRQENTILGQADENWLYILGRTKPGVNVNSLQAKLSTNLRHWLATQDAYTRDGRSARIPSQHVVVISGRTGIQNLQQQTSRELYLLMAISGLLLLVACANVANLLLTRAMIRNAETSVRIALGAARSRLLRQMLVESILLGLLGGFAGLIVSYVGVRTILALTFPGSVHLPIHAGPTASTLAFTLLLSLLTGVTFGIAPAWMTSRAKSAEAQRRATPNRDIHLSLLQKFFIVFQAALSIILLLGAGLLTRSLSNVEHQNFGLQTTDRYVLHLDPRSAGYGPKALETLNKVLERRFRNLPGVQGVGLALYSPLEGNNWLLGVFGEDHPNAEMGASFDRVSSHFFQTVGEPFVQGRNFTDQDTASTQMVAVINQAFAKKLFPNENPIGKRFGNWSPRYADSFEVIGVVADAKYASPREPVRPMFFRPLNQWKRDLPKPNWATLESWSLYINSITIEFRGQPQDLNTMARRTLADINSNLTVISLDSFDNQISSNFTQERLIGRLSMLFSLLALVLASIGLYGITSYHIARRTHEVEACAESDTDRSDVIWPVLRGVFLQVGLGLVIGIPVALSAASVMKDELYEIRSFDPLSLTVAVGTLTIATAAAGFISARRAASIQPTKVLSIE